MRKHTNLNFRWAIVAVMLMSSATLQAQVYKTSTGKVSFYSHTSVEDIDATNSTAAAGVSASTGAVEFSVLINSFQFKKALMQKHFQENYMESPKFPKSTFKGALVDKNAVNFNKDGVYNVSVKGNITIHGVTKEIEVPGKIEVKGKKITLVADFSVNPKDYDIKIPATNASQISDNIKVSVNCELSKK